MRSRTMSLSDDGDLELDKWQWKGSTEMALRWGGQRNWRGNKKRKPIFLAYILKCHSEDKHLVWEREDEFICGQTEFCYLWAITNITC